MSLKGPDFYDDPTVFSNYVDRRSRSDSPNDTLELPVVEELLGSPFGQDFLDLGCGDGTFGQRLLNAEASSYFGVDGSENMIHAAQANLSGTAGSVQLERLESLRLPTSKFTRASARLVLHYLEDLTHTFREVAQALREDGLFVFSVEHPVITSSDHSSKESSLRQTWTVDDYFVAGPRVTSWMGGSVVKHHRTVEDYFVAVQAAGLQVEALREARPRPQHFVDDALFRRRSRIPLFLIMSARKTRRAVA